MKRPPEIAPTMIGIIVTTMSSSIRVNPFSPRAARRCPPVALERQPPQTLDTALREIIDRITFSLLLIIYRPKSKPETVSVKAWVVVPLALEALIVK